VLTAVVLRHPGGTEFALSESEVRFREISPQEIRAYVASGEADDKAGAYGIQGMAARFIPEIRGSYSGIMGLPLYETATLLSRLGASRQPAAR
jgi:septum formation protein